MVSARPRAHLRGLDSIRFLAALWVVLSHVGAFPLPPQVANAHGAIRVFVGLYHCAFDGPAAVMVFFVISGIVIHTPYADGEALVPGRFLLRRLLRIGAPLIGAVGLEKLLGLASLGPVLWSLYAEMVYYVLYPALLSIRRRTGWRPLFTGALLGSLLLVATNAGLVSPVQYSPWAGWIFGLPVWLGGAWLAERWHRAPLRAFTPARRWAVRAIVWVASAATMGLHFHAGLFYTRTLVVFGALATSWLAVELTHFNAGDARPPSRLERAGLWSYSLYLTHPITSIVWRDRLGSPTGIFSYSAMMLFIGVGAYAFYLAIERPAHALARRIGRA